MTENDELKTLRRYTRQEAALMLNINDRWLKEWVSENLVPHQRKGQVRGVWFTYEDVVAIGGMLPTLMSDRQANGRSEVTAATAARAAAGHEESECGVLEARVRGAVSTDQIVRFRDLRRS